MPLTQLGAKALISWTLAKTNTGTGATGQNGSVTFNLNGVSLASFTQLYWAQISLAAGAHQDIDVTSLTNLVGESVNFGHLLTILVQPATAAISLSPASANPITWWFGTDLSAFTPINPGGCHFFSEPVGGPGYAVSGTHKTFRITNTGGVTGVTTLTIAGGP